MKTLLISLLGILLCLPIVTYGESNETTLPLPYRVISIGKTYSYTIGPLKIPHTFPPAFLQYCDGAYDSPLAYTLGYHRYQYGGAVLTTQRVRCFNT